MNLGSFATKKLALMDASALEHLVGEVASLYVSSAAGVDGIVAERDRSCRRQFLASCPRFPILGSAPSSRLTGNAWWRPGGRQPGSTQWNKSTGIFFEPLPLSHFSVLPWMHARPTCRLMTFG